MINYTNLTKQVLQRLIVLGITLFTLGASNFITTNTLAVSQFAGGTQVLTKWDFGDETKRNLVTSSNNLSNYSNDVPIDQTHMLSLNGGPVFAGWTNNQGGSGTFAPNTNGWDNGANSKYWLFSLSSSDKKDLKVNYSMKGSSTGPRDFSLEYSTSSSAPYSWLPITGGTIQASEFFQSLSSISVPVNADNKQNLHFRLLQTSNISTNGGTVDGTGTNTIGEFSVTGVDLQFSVQYLAGNGGSISGISNQLVINNGSTTSVTAVANEGYDFVDWNDGNTNPTRLDNNITSDRQFTANFALKKFTVVGESPSIVIIDKSSSTNISNEQIDFGTDKAIQIMAGQDNHILVDYIYRFTSNLDLTSFLYGYDVSGGKSFVHGLSGSYDLYIPKLPNSTGVGICPGAMSLDLSKNCPNYFELKEGDSRLRIETIGNKTYWKVLGVTGTGGINTFNTNTTSTNPTLANTGDSFIVTFGIYIFAVTGIVSCLLALITRVKKIRNTI